MAYKAHQLPGFKVGGRLVPVYLPDWIPVSIRVINHERFRSFTKSGAHTKTTFHDTSNPNTDAEAEYRWAAGGRQGGSVGGYNGIVDDSIFIVTQPFDEDVWAAGTYSGNHTSYHIEFAWGANSDFYKGIEISCAVHGAIIAAKGWTVEGAFKWHEYWYGKYCPRQVFDRGLRTYVINKVKAYAAASRAAAGGTGMNYPRHMTFAVARGLFGKVVATVDGQETVYEFNENGRVSNAWMEYGNATDTYPELKRVSHGSAGQKHFIFEGGRVLYDPADGGPIVLVGADK